jgi:Glycosyl transferase family 2
MTESARGEHSVCLFVTLKARLADTLSFVYYHLNSGFDHLYLFFDDPADPAIEALKGEKRLTCIRCDESHWQKLLGDIPRSKLSINIKQEANAREAVKSARQDGFAWIGHLDSDELLYAPGGFKHLISTLPAGVEVVKLPAREIIPESLSTPNIFLDLHFFRIGRQAMPKNRRLYLDPHERFPYFLGFLSYRVRQLAAGLLGCPTIFTPYMKGHVNGKSITRTTAPIFSSRSHYPIPTNDARLKVNLLSSAMVLHYDFPDYEHWLTKWRNRYLAFQQGIVPMKLSVHRQKQYEEFVRVYEGGSEEELLALFRRNLLLSPRVRRILTWLRLAEEVHLPGHLFDPPTGDTQPAGTRDESGR